jgi:hypothetical protein
MAAFIEDEFSSKVAIREKAKKLCPKAIERRET